MEKPTVINGQPQGLGNRMVTWDGLSDFFNMLKNEIPRMGVNNIAGSYSYSLGQNNKDYSRLSFLVGDGNKVNVNEKEYSYLNYLFGAGNEVNGGKYTFTFGSGNVHKVAEDRDTSAFGVIFGSSNLNRGQHCFLAGHYNLMDQAASYTYVFGKGNYGGEDSNKMPVGIGLSNGFIVGQDNQISNPIFFNGDLNVQNERIYVFGSRHKIHNAQGIVCFGENNIVNNGDNITYNTFLCGSNLTGWYQGNTPMYILGQYNNYTAIEYDPDPKEGPVKLGAALVIGDGHSNVNSDPTRSNLLVIGYDGEFRLKNGYFSQPTAFNDMVTFNDVIECNDAAIFSATTTFKGDLEMYNKSINIIKVTEEKDESGKTIATRAESVAKFAPDGTTFSHDLKVSNASINIIKATEEKDENGEITNIREDSVAKFASDGITFSHNVSFNNPDSSVIYGAGFGQTKLQRIRYNYVQIIDGAEEIENLAPVIYYDHGFRHMLHAWQDPNKDSAAVNEAFWTIRNVKDEYGQESTLHINYSSPGIFKQDIEEEAKTWAGHYAPHEIHFHKGTPGSYAKLKCDDLIIASKQVRYSASNTEDTFEGDLSFTNFTPSNTTHGRYFVSCSFFLLATTNVDAGLVTGLYIPYTISGIVDLNSFSTDWLCVGQLVSPSGWLQLLIQYSDQQTVKVRITDGDSGSGSIKVNGINCDVVKLYALPKQETT